MPIFEKAKMQSSALEDMKIPSLHSQENAMNLRFLIALAALSGP
jgi:hypothetical protein